MGAFELRALLLHNTAPGPATGEALDLRYPLSPITYRNAMCVAY